MNCPKCMFRFSLFLLRRETKSRIFKMILTTIRGPPTAKQPHIDNSQQRETKANKKNEWRKAKQKDRHQSVHFT